LIESGLSGLSTLASEGFSLSLATEKAGEHEIMKEIPMSLGETVEDKSLAGEACSVEHKDPAVHYAQFTLLRGLVASIPVIGPVLDSWVGGRGQNLFAERIGRLIDELDRQAHSLREEKVDRIYLESEEFYDLFRS